jgi:hypothetical protein
MIRKTPTIPLRGPMPCADKLGMGTAVDMLFNLLTAKPCLKGEKHSQFDLMRQPRATFTSAWESSPGGIREGATFVTGAMKVTVTSCPTQQRWFGLFLRGAEKKDGLCISEEPTFGSGGSGQDVGTSQVQSGRTRQLGGQGVLFGAAAALAVCGSLRGPEVFLLDLAGLWKYIEMDKDGVMPHEPLKAGTNLSRAPHVIATLIGEFKGELGTRHHLLALASITSSSIELQWWLENLMSIREKKGCRTGPAFGHKDGSAGLISENNTILHYFLRILQKEEPDMIFPTDDIKANYSLLHTFQRTADGRARAAQLDRGDQNAMNR